MAGAIYTQKRYAGAVDDRSDMSDVDQSWTNINNVLGAPDDTCATITSMNENKTAAFAVDSFGFTIPAGATLVGFTVKAWAHQQNDDSISNLFSYRAGLSGKSAGASTGAWQPVTMFTHDGSFNSGNCDDIYESHCEERLSITPFWNLSPQPTVAQINSDNFAILVIADGPNNPSGYAWYNFYYDAIEITVYFTMPDPTTTVSYSEDLTALEVVEKIDLTQRIDKTSYATLHCKADVGENRDAWGVILDEQLITITDPQDNAVTLFRGYVRDVISEQSTSRAFSIFARDPSFLLAKKRSTYNSIQFGPKPIEGLDTNKIEHSDITTVGGYISGDHGAMVVPSGSVSATTVDFDGRDAGPAGGTPTWVGAIGNINDEDPDTVMELQMLHTLLESWLEISGTAPVGTVKARFSATVYIAVGALQTQTVKLQYYKHSAADWEDFPAGSGTIEFNNDLGIIGFHTSAFDLWGFVTESTDDFLDGSRDFRIRIYVTDESAGQETQFIYIKDAKAECYTNPFYDCSYFPISAYAVGEVTVSPDPANQGVSQGDYVLFGEDDKDLIEAMFAEFPELPFDLDVDANIAGSYTARDWAGTSLLELVNYMCKKHQARWWYAPNDNTLYIKKESSWSASGVTLLDSDLQNARVKRSADSRVSKVVMEGASFLVQVDATTTAEAQVKFTFPDDSQDSPDPASAYAGPFIERNSNVYTQTEAYTIAKAIYEAKNNPQPAVTALPVFANTAIVIGETLDEITIDSKTHSAIPIVGMEYQFLFGQNLLQQTLICGFTRTPEPKKIGQRINKLERDVENLFKRLTGIFTFPKGNEGTQAGHSPVTVSNPLGLTGQALSLKYNTDDLELSGDPDNNLQIKDSGIDHDATTGFVANEHLPGIDEDNMASDSAAHVPTQQSTKAYVDTELTTHAGVAAAHHTKTTDAGELSSGTIPDARIQASGVTQHQGSIDHDALSNFVANEHLPGIDEDNMASDSDAHVPTQQSVKAYADTKLATHENDATQQPSLFMAGNGASITGSGDAPIIYMPASDNDCQFRVNFHIPSHFPSGSCNLKIKYFISGTNAWSLLWYVGSYADGAVVTTYRYNVLNADSTEDFPAGTSQQVYVKTIALSDADIGPDKMLAVQGQSDASNSDGLRILNIWIEP